MAVTQGAEYDLLIVGGGINGAGVARDAAGRGLATLLIDQGDFGGATSSASTKLIHGGLRYLEHREFRLVAESLAEREVVMRLAPHLVWPLRFVMPHVPSLRPAWMIRAGLWLYDHLGGRGSLPRSTAVRLRADGYGAGLKPQLVRGFSYFDAWTDDARLVILNLKSASRHGARLWPRTRLIGAVREQGRWRASLEDLARSRRFDVHARVLVNAAGPWVKQVTDLSESPVAARVRLVKGSHLVVPRVHSGDHAYILQNTDKRVIFVIPYQDAHTLIGTTDAVIDAVEQGQSITSEEIDYLLAAVNRYLIRPLAAGDVLWSYSGVRPLYDDGKGDPAAISRDYTLVRDERAGAMQLAIFGGKLTTYRKLAETVVDRLAPRLHCRRGAWTGSEPLPGGGFAPAAREAELQRTLAAWPQLPPALLGELFRRHGRAVAEVLGDARTPADLGRDFGGGLHQREAEYLIAEEWAMAAGDILWRRTKSGLRMSAAQRDEFADWFAGVRAAA